MSELGLHIFTIGYSNHSLDKFIELLRRHAVTAIADVRSHPYSRLPEFNREALKAVLRRNGIHYVFLGLELGARRDEKEAYVGVQANYERIAELPAFQSGVQRLREGAEMYAIALMCAEKEPLDCHRTILICRYLRRLGFEIDHILADGSLENHSTTEKRLLEITENTPTLFDHTMPSEERIEKAYDARGLEIAYRQACKGESHDRGVI